MRVFAMFLLASAQLFAQGRGSGVVSGWGPGSGAISGTVVDATDGAAVASAIVKIFLDSGGQIPVVATADGQGRYVLEGIGEGRYRLEASVPRQSTIAHRAVILREGERRTGLDIRVQARLPMISGKVTDETREPVAGAMVRLVSRYYLLGSLRYKFGTPVTTNERGEYSLKVPEAGRGVLLLAAVPRDDAKSRAEDNPDQRVRVLTPTYFPGSSTAASAEVLTLRPAEQREHLDIRLVSAPSYCISGRLRADQIDGVLSYFLAETEPFIGTVSYFYGPAAKTEAGGRFRSCGLHPGAYRLTTESAPTKTLGVRSSTSITITDHDVTDIDFTPAPPSEELLQVSWDGEPVASKARMPVRISIVAVGGMQSIHSTCMTPCERSYPLFKDEGYTVSLEGLPERAYVKSVTYGGMDLTGQPYWPGTLSNAPLRIVLGRDGATMLIALFNRENRPVSDAFVYIIPAEANSAIELADALISGETSPDGSFQSKFLRPGKYLVLASTGEITTSPESIELLWDARLRGREVELGPGGSLRMQLEPLALR